MIDFGQDVYLDSLKEENIADYRLARNIWSTRKWCRQRGLISDLDQYAWYIEQNNDPTIEMFEIQDKELHTVGVCGLTDIDHVNQRAEFSLYIYPEERSNGFAKKALKTLFSHGFQDLNLNHIFGETFDGNPAAKLFKSVGMTNEGTRRKFYFKDGEFIDCDFYSILREEWPQQSQY